MKFEWDDKKDQANQRKHGLSFLEATAIFASEILTLEDPRFYGEVRRISYGQIRASVVIAAVVHTDRNGVTRIISARIASRKERNLYNAYLARKIGPAGSDPG